MLCWIPCAGFSVVFWCPISQSCPVPPLPFPRLDVINSWMWFLLKAVPHCPQTNKHILPQCSTHMGTFISCKLPGTWHKQLLMLQRKGILEEWFISAAQTPTLLSRIKTGYSVSSSSLFFWTGISGQGLSSGQFSVALYCSRPLDLQSLFLANSHKQVLELQLLRESISLHSRVFGWSRRGCLPFLRVF